MIKYLFETLSVIVGVSILVLTNIIFAGIVPVIISPIINMMGGLIAVIPPSIIIYTRYRTRKELETQFLVFIRDLTDSINTGMTLPIALERCSRRDYLSLSPYIDKMSAKVNWGVPFEKALQSLANNINLLTIKRAITTIIETYKVGGKLSDTLAAVGRSLVTIDRIKSERTASVHAQIITSYLIFFVFIFILVVLQVFLLPALLPTAGAGIPGVTAGAPVQRELFNQSFINFIIIQGFFAGLVTGKMAEGEIVAGIKHSVLLITLGYTIFAFTSQFQIQLF